MPNRLRDATSPYLLQHADNPVDWWEWSPEAFAEARERDVPVLLSVGYAACHWCHVMAHESFEDAATASHMNDRFTNVKVDREERPDVDAVYMQATTAMTGQGGWPMTVLLTPDGEPFFAGTYFPDRPRHGQPAFRQVLEALSEAWRTRRDEVTKVAADVVAATCAGHRPLAGEEPIDADVLAAAVGLARRRRSTARPAGSGARRSSRRRWCWSSCSGTQRAPATPNASGMADRTLRAMARGGLYDQLGGGFARYSVDAVLGGAALREDALRQRAAARRLRPLVAAERRPAGGAGGARDRRVPADRAAHRPGRVRLRARRRQRGGRGQVLRLDAGAAARGARATRTAAGRPACSR